MSCVVTITIHALMQCVQYYLRM